MLPDVRPHIQAGESRGHAHEVGRLLAEQAVNGADQTGRGRQPDQQQAHHDHRRDEVRQVQDGLESLAEALGADLVNHQRKQDGKRKACQHAVNAQPQGIADGGSALEGIEEPHEVLEQRIGPGAPHDAQGVFIVLEGDDDAVHGLVGKHQHEDK